MADRSHRSLYRLATEADRALHARDYQTASELYAMALELPSVPAAQCAALLSNLGLAWQGLNQIEKATAAFEDAVRAKPNLASAQIGLGNMYALRGRHSEAVDHFDVALKLEPTSGIAHTNRALSLQGLGRIEEAWEEMEWRYSIPTANSFYPYRYAKPRWKGEPLHGRTLLVHREQGLGDVIQYIRFLPLLHHFGGRVIFECPRPILPLISPHPELETIPAETHPVPEEMFDGYVPLLSLPHDLKYRAQDLPATCPYVPGGSDKNEHSKHRGDDALRIGIVWSASALGRSRNVPLVELLPLRNLSARLVSVQKEVDDAEQRTLSEHGIENAGSAFRHFGDTRDAIVGLDAVVTVDTAVAHLAGALAKPTWLLLNDPAPPRWAVNRTNTPWYPTMRIHRRRDGGAWAEVIARVANEIARDSKAC